MGYKIELKIQSNGGEQRWHSSGKDEYTTTVKMLELIGKIVEGLCERKSIEKATLTISKQ